MAGSEKETKFEENDSFVWDENSNLYYHPSTGFYHDPTTGWYYSTTDGLYYTFEDGSYRPLQGGQGDKSGSHQSISMDNMEPNLDSEGFPECISDGIDCQRPTSEWLEETLINSYLSGYPGPETSKSSMGSQDVSYSQLGSDEASSPKDTTLQCHSEGEGNMEHPPDSSDRLTGQATVSTEENWLAQYGQVVREEDDSPCFHVIDLWDWEMVMELVKNHHVARLSGRLIKPSSKLHPSLRSVLKTAAICEVHLDLVRVASGKIYRLRTPSKRYLSSLATYDSSNITKDWGFPNIPIDVLNTGSANSDLRCEPQNSFKDEISSITHIQVNTSSDKERRVYRDRAAERRNIYGSFNIGPGQKTLFDNKLHEAQEDLQSSDADSASLVSTNLTFGPGSYSRKILERMGWKEGDALGKTKNGITEPLQAVGNKGHTGLGWNQRT